MGQGWCCVGLCCAPLLLPLLSTAHNQPGDKVLGYQASVEVIPDPLLPTWEGRVGQWWSRG